MVNPEEAMNLLGYAWRLWREDKALEFMDIKLWESCNTNEFLKCLNVALLCAQDDPGDRPTMSDIVVLLSSEIASLPIPEQPAFVERKGLYASVSSSSSSNQEISTQWATTSGGR